MIFVVCAILPLFYGALASPSADQYIDSVLRIALPNQIRTLSMDPATLQNFNTEFQDKIAIIGKVKGKVNYTDGQLTGLSSPQRFSPCGGPTYKYGIPTINCTIGFQNLKASYNGKMKYGKMPVVSVKGKANITTTTLFIEVSSPSPTSPPQLDKFFFQQLGQIQTKFTGLGSPMNKFLKVLEDGYKAHVGAEILNSIQQRFSYAFKNAVSQVPMPR